MRLHGTLCGSEIWRDIRVVPYIFVYGGSMSRQRGIFRALLQLFATSAHADDRHFQVSHRATHTRRSRNASSRGTTCRVLLLPGASRACELSGPGCQRHHAVPIFTSIQKSPAHHRHRRITIIHSTHRPMAEGSQHCERSPCRDHHMGERRSVSFKLRSERMPRRMTNGIHP